MPAKLPVCAFILAGGKSSRMGQDKAFVELDGQTLLQSAKDKATKVASSVTVVGPREKFGSDALEDVFRNCGPLAGIHAALASSSCELNLILAVDMPRVDPGFLRMLLEQAAASGAIVTVPRTSDGFQPLCAVYHKSFQPLAEAALTEGRYKIDALFTQVPLRIIDEREMKQFAFDPAMFQNLNTPAEYQAAKARSYDR